MPLELVGATAGPSNLWPQPRIGPDGWDADLGHDPERALGRVVRHGRLSLPGHAGGHRDGLDGRLRVRRRVGARGMG